LGGNENNLEELRILKIWEIPNNQKGRLMYVDLQMTHRQRKHEDISKAEDCLINLAWTSLCYQSSPSDQAHILQPVVKSITLETCLSLYVFVCERTHRVSWSADFCMLDHLRGYNINQ
jgi:hypothetical protein